MSSIWFHMTPIENLSDILQRGLVMYQSSTSDQDNPLGHYISSNWIELLASDTYPEIFRYESVAVLSVNTFGLSLIEDPEYHKDDDSDGFNVRVIQNRIVLPDRLGVECILDMSRISRGFKTDDYRDFCIMQHDRYKCSSNRYKQETKYTEMIIGVDYENDFIY